MSMIRNLHDTYLHFLNDNLTGIPVREVRFDKNDPTAESLEIGALNVEFQNRDYNIIGVTTVILNVVSDDQFTAMDWEEQISKLHQATAFWGIQDYSAGTPAPVGKNFTWASKLSFRPVVNGNYYHSMTALSLTS